jgi:anti-anti-sigma factor
MIELEVVEASDSLSHVALRGRLDLEGVREVELPFTSQTCSRRKPAIVDLSGLSILTSVGIGLLVRCAVTLRRHGAPTVLLAPQEDVRTLLEATGIQHVTPMADSRDQALEILAAR